MFVFGTKAGQLSSAAEADERFGNLLRKHIESTIKMRLRDENKQTYKHRFNVFREALCI